MIKNNRWTRQPADSSKVQQLQIALNIHPLLCELLVQRGIENYEQAKQFFRPSLDHLHDPFLMKDMDKAILRIEKAIKNQEQILIYGDYDVDGTTSVALAYSFFSRYTAHIDYYIPDRYEEGYGISIQSIDYAAKHNVSLIIALDCGIKALQQIEYAQQHNIDFIICDHHLPGSDLPNAHAVLDPKREDCIYPYKELSGCGIGFKLVEAYAQKNNISLENITDLLQLVAISIASDIVPITGENRTLAYFGLEELRNDPFPGIQSLLEVAGLEKNNITIEELVFKVGPKINAAGRMGDAKDAVKLLLSEKGLANDNAHILNNHNTSRKETDEQITQEALKIVEEELQGKKASVVFREHWHKGVVGIVASRLIEKYHRPTIVLTKSNGLLTGSARSVKGFNVHEAIKCCEDLLEQYGGHKYAAGLSMKPENFEAFKTKFENVVAASIKPEQLTPEIDISIDLEFTEITVAFFNILQQFAPFGPENMKPVFRTKKLYDTGWSKVIKNKHLKCSVYQTRDIKMSGIGFNMSAYYNIVKSGNFEMCYTLEENEWNGNKSLQLHIKDIK